MANSKNIVKLGGDILYGFLGLAYNTIAFGAKLAMEILIKTPLLSLLHLLKARPTRTI